MTTADAFRADNVTAILLWAAGSDQAPSDDARPDEDDVLALVDLHALTVPQDPAELRTQTLDLATLFLAVGIDPAVATLFVQSHVAEHTALGWLMECTASMGELRRMTQFKDKAGSAEACGAFVSGGLFTYPALMAADILLYDTAEVPVGDDQRQHVELTRDLAERFNSRYGDTFVVPRAVIAKAGARVMDLQEPTRKMSKSEDSPAGTINVLEDLASVTKKIKRAVTDTESEVRFDPTDKPGVSNLLSILAACTGRTPEEAAEGYSQYGPLKADTAAAVAAVLEPIQARHRALAADPGEVTRLLAVGADKARAVAGPTLARARHALGLSTPG